MFETLSVAVDPLVIQLNEELDKIDPRISSFNSKMEEVQSLFPANLSTTIFKIKGDLEKLEKAQERRKLFKRIPIEKNPIIDFEGKFQEIIDQKVQNKFTAARQARQNTLLDFKGKTKQINKIKTKINEISEKRKNDLTEITRELTDLLPQYNTISSTPLCLLTKLEKDSQNFARQVGEFNNEIDSYMDRIRLSRTFRAKFGGMSNSFEIDDDTNDNADGKYEIPDLTVPFYAVKSDIDNMITTLVSETNEIDNKYAFIEETINAMNKSFHETATNQEDMAAVLHNTEDKALELLCEVDQTQENIDSISVAGEVEEVKSQMATKIKDLKTTSAELKRMVMKMEDDYEHEQIQAFING